MNALKWLEIIGNGCEGLYDGSKWLKLVSDGLK